MSTDGAHRQGVSFCPSAQPDWAGSVVIGVVEGTAEEPRLAHFPSALPVTEELLQMAQPVTPTEVFRFGAPCMGAGCEHFHNQRCGLVTQIVQLLPAVIEALPVCGIRSTCRWWQQEGRAACMRCPQVVTDNYRPSPEMRIASTPQPAFPAELP